MRLYVIRRPDGWGTAQELAAAAARSKRVGDEEMPADVRWIRSYVVREASGALGTFCIYEASSIEKIREHAERAGIPATDVFEVADTVVIRPDPVALAARGAVHGNAKGRHVPALRTPSLDYTATAVGGAAMPTGSVAKATLSSTA